MMRSKRRELVDGSKRVMTALFPMTGSLFSRRMFRTEPSGPSTALPSRKPGFVSAPHEAGIQLLVLNASDLETVHDVGSSRSASTLAWISIAS